MPNPVSLRGRCPVRAEAGDDLAVVAASTENATAAADYVRLFNYLEAAGLRLFAKTARAIIEHRQLRHAKPVLARRGQHGSDAPAQVRAATRDQRGHQNELEAGGATGKRGHQSSRRCWRCPR